MKKIFPTACVVFCVFLLVFLLNCTIAQTTNPTWNIQTVTTNKVGDSCSFVLDSNGNPHISFEEKGNFLAYASWNGLNWNTQHVDDIYSRIPIHSSLVLDAHGNPNICYWDSDIQNFHDFFKYANWTSSKWDIQTIIENDGADTISLVLDSQGTPHVVCTSFWSYQARDSGELLYVSWNGSSWNSQYIGGLYRSDCPLVLDSADNPHLCCIVENKSLIYYSLNGSNWNSQTIDQYADSCSLALDSSDNPHISYTNKDGNLMYDSWTGASWKNQTVNIAGGHSSLALDFADIPHLSYSNDKGFNYAVWSEKGWSTQIIDKDGTSGVLDLDSHGNPHISYLTSTSLKYASLSYSTATSNPTNSSIIPKYVYATVIGGVVAVVVLAVLLLLRKKQQIKKSSIAS